MTRMSEPHSCCRRPVGLIVLLLSLSGGLPTSTPAAQAAGEPADAGPPLRVMSFNIRYGTANDGEDRWEKRKALLVKTIRAFGPDVLGVQEALAFQCDELGEALDGYAFFGAGRDDGKRAGEFSGIFYKTDRFERLDGGHFWLSEAPDVPGSKNWDAAITRMATWVKLRAKAAAGAGGAEGGKQAGDLLVMNTHWDHKGRQARLESAKIIRRRLRELQPGGPAVLIGDLNVREDDPPYAELVRPADDTAGPKLLDSYRQAHPDRTPDEATFHGFKGGTMDSRIDFIFHTPDFQTAEAAIDRTAEGGRYPSDHYPVTAVLTRVDDPAPVETKTTPRLR